MPYWCGDCRNHFSVRIGTLLYCAKVSYRKWAIAIHLYLSNPRGTSSRQLAHDIGVTQKTVWPCCTASGSAGRIPDRCAAGSPR